MIAETIAMLVFYLPQTLHWIGEKQLAKEIFSFSKIYLFFNCKERNLTYGQVIGAIPSVHEAVRGVGKKATRKMHSVLHSPNKVLRDGAYYNYGACSFEGYFNGLKQVSEDFKRSPVPSLQNYASNLINQNLFSSFSVEQLRGFGLDSGEIELFRDAFSPTKTNRDETTTKFLTYFDTEQQKQVTRNLITFSRTTVEGVKVTIEDYDKCDTIDHLFCLSLNENPCFVCLAAFETRDNSLYIRIGEPQKQQEMAEIFGNFVHLVLFSPQIIRIPFQKFRKILGYSFQKDLYYLTDEKASI